MLSREICRAKKNIEAFSMEQKSATNFSALHIFQLNVFFCSIFFFVVSLLGCCTPCRYLGDDPYIYRIIRGRSLTMAWWGRRQIRGANRIFWGISMDRGGNQNFLGMLMEGTDCFFYH